MNGVARLAVIAALAVLVPLITVVMVMISMEEQVTVTVPSVPNFKEFENFEKKFEKNRVAILMAGTLQRLMLNSTGQHVVEPLRQDNWQVDLYLSFLTGKVKGFREAADSFQSEAEFEGLNKAGIEGLLTQRFGHFGGQVVHLRVFDQLDPSPEDLKFIENPHFWGNGQRGFVARKNFLLMWKELDLLWYHAQAHEHLNGKYSYVP